MQWCYRDVRKQQFRLRYRMFTFKILLFGFNQWRKIHCQLQKKNVYRKCYQRFQATVSSFDKGKLNIYMLFVGWKVRVLKNCYPGLENAARGSRAAFPGRPNSANNMFIVFFFFFEVNWFYRSQMGLFTQLCPSIGLRDVY